MAIADNLSGAGRIVTDSSSTQNRVAIAELGVIAGHLRSGYSVDQVHEIVRGRISALLRQSTTGATR